MLTDTPRFAQYKVIVTDGMVAGQLIRAGYNGHEWLVRVPAGSVPGDSIIFRMTEENIQEAMAKSKDPDAIPYTNETACLESSLTVKVSTPKHISGWLAALLIDPQRVVFLGSIFVLAFVGGLVTGTLHYTRFEADL